MADNDHDHDDEPIDEHTDEQHAAHGKIIGKIFNEALRKCVSAGICKIVLIHELVNMLVEATATSDISLSDIVAEVIDEYFELAAAKAEVAVGGRSRVH